MKDNKIWVIGIVALAVILLIVSFSIGGGDEESNNELEGNYSEDVEQIIKNAQAESAAVKDDEKGEFTYINVDEYLNLYSADSNTLVLLARPTCGYCEIAEPIIRNIIYVYNLDIKYLNTDEFTEDTQRQFVSSNEMFKEGYGTPLLMLVGNNNINDIVDGLTDYAGYMEFLQKNEIIIP